MLPGITGAILAAVGYSSEFSVTTGSATETLTNYPIGDPHPARRVFIVFHWGEGATHRTLSSMTIGGVSATIHEQSGHSGGVSGLGAAIASAIVPTGTTATIVPTMSGGSTAQHAICGYIVYNATNSSPTDTASAQTAGTADDVSTTINVDDGGFVIAGYTSSIFATSKSVTWTGVTENYDEGGDGRRSGGIATNLGTQVGRTIEADVSSATADAGNCLVVVSWR